MSVFFSYRSLLTSVTRLFTSTATLSALESTPPVSYVLPARRILLAADCDNSVKQLNVVLDVGTDNMTLLYVVYRCRLHSISHARPSSCRAALLIH